MAPFRIDSFEYKELGEFAMKFEEYLEYIKSQGNRMQYKQACEDVHRMCVFGEKWNLNLSETVLANPDCIASYLALSNYNEPLYFAMNRYYQIMSQNPGLSIPKDTFREFPERFIFQGSKEELSDYFEIIMSRENAEKMSHNIAFFNKMLDKDEGIELEIKSVGGGGNCFWLMREEWKYNINIKAFSLVAISLLLDIKLTLGFASSVLAIMGVNGQAIFKVSAREAEKCMIMEAIHNRNHIIDENIIDLIGKECVHNDFDCKYREDGKCTITKTAVKEILDRLADKNVFTRVHGLYKYNF